MLPINLDLKIKSPQTISLLSILGCRSVCFAVLSLFGKYMNKSNEVWIETFCCLMDFCFLFCILNMQPWEGWFFHTSRCRNGESVTSVASSLASLSFFMHFILSSHGKYINCVKSKQYRLTYGYPSHTNTLLPIGRHLVIVSRLYYCLRSFVVVVAYHFPPYTFLCLKVILGLRIVSPQLSLLLFFPVMIIYFK